MAILTWSFVGAIRLLLGSSRVGIQLELRLATSGLLLRCYLTLLQGDSRLREVYEGSRTTTALRTILWAHTLGSTELPEPGVIIDDLDLLVVEEHLPRLAGLLIVVPLLEVDKHPLVLLTLAVGLLHHIHLLQLTEAKVAKDRLHTSLGDVREHTGDADRRSRSTESAKVKLSNVGRHVVS